MKKRASRIIGYMFRIALLVNVLGARAVELQWFGQSVFKM